MFFLEFQARAGMAPGRLDPEKFGSLGNDGLGRRVLAGKRVGSAGKSGNSVGKAPWERAESPKNRDWEFWKGEGKAGKAGKLLGTVIPFPGMLFPEFLMESGIPPGPPPRIWGRICGFSWDFPHLALQGGFVTFQVLAARAFLEQLRPELVDLGMRTQKILDFPWIFHGFSSPQNAGIQRIPKFPIPRESVIPKPPKNEEFGVIPKENFRKAGIGVSSGGVKPWGWNSQRIRLFLG